MAQADIESVLKEERVFQPPQEFSAKARIKSFAEYEQLYKQAQDDPEGFWASMAKELDWFKPWDKVLEWNPPFAKWFTGGRINIAHNCLDRHLTTARKNKAAIIWEGEPGDERILKTADYLRDHSSHEGGFFQNMIHSGINAYLTLHLAQVRLRAGDHVAAWDLMDRVVAMASPTGQWPGCGG